MRELERIDRILNKIKTLWKQFPDQRFFQLGINYYFPKIENDNILYYLEDNILERHIDKIIKYINTNEKQFKSDNMTKDLIDEIMHLFDKAIDLSTPDYVEYEIDKNTYKQKLEKLFKENDKI